MFALPTVPRCCKNTERLQTNTVALRNNFLVAKTRESLLDLPLFFAQFKIHGRHFLFALSGDWPSYGDFRLAMPSSVVMLAPSHRRSIRSRVVPP